jgi:hypothetical protein
MALGIDYNSGIPHTDGAPVHDPGTNGGKIAYDHVARVLYKHVSGTTWEVLATGGGGGDSLGTGFTSGGGSGTIPNGTVAESNALSYPVYTTYGNSAHQTADGFPVTGIYATDGSGNNGLFGFFDEEGFPYPYIEVFDAGAANKSRMWLRPDIIDFTTTGDVSFSGVTGNSNIDSKKIRLNATEGVRLPNMSTTVRDGIASPDEGAQIYNTDTHKPNYHNGSQWVEQSGGVPYKVYTALLTQSGTDAPVATVLENTLGGSVTWSYFEQGTYNATLPTAWTTEQIITINGAASEGLQNSAFAGSIAIADGVVQVTTGIVGSSLIDDELFRTMLEIRIYQ